MNNGYFDESDPEEYDDCGGCDLCNPPVVQYKLMGCEYEIEYVIVVEPHLKTTRTYYEYETHMLNDYECLVRNGNDIIWCGKLRT